MVFVISVNSVSGCGEGQCDNCQPLIPTRHLGKLPLTGRLKKRYLLENWISV